MSLRLSKRLNTCLKYTKGFNMLQDIGTDHAYLPIKAIKLGYVNKCIASDVNKGPLEKAFNNVKKYDLENVIKTSLSDGLSNIDKRVDVVVIAGMGGILIKRILSEGDLSNVKRFILQPNNNSKEVRKWLILHNFMIIDENFITDKNKSYEVIVFERGNQILSETELEFGPFILKKKNIEFINFITGEIRKLKEVLEFVKDQNELKRIDDRISFLMGVIL